MSSAFPMMILFMSDCYVAVMMLHYWNINLCLIGDLLYNTSHLFLLRG